MGTGSFIKSDLLQIHNYVQLSAVMYPKWLIIEQLREFFSQDSYYVYRTDAWGFAKIPDHTDMPLDAGFNDNSTSRIFIGEAFRQNAIFYPSVLVKNSGTKASPISFNREKETVQWVPVQYIDGYGNISIQSTPSHLIHAGAFEGTIAIDITTRSLRARDELVDLISILFIDTAMEDLVRAGVAIKPNSISVSTPSETDDRNDKLFKQTVSLEYRSEWRRHIPVESVVDVIKFCVEFGHNLDSDSPVLAPNLKISTDIDLIQQLQEL